MNKAILTITTFSVLALVGIPFMATPPAFSNQGQFNPGQTNQVLSNQSLIKPDKAEPKPAKDSPFIEIKKRSVDLDQLIKNSRTEKKGQRYLFDPIQVDFNAVIQQLPKPAKADYLLNALHMMGTNPLPQVQHQMFIRSPQGKVIAVYVEKRLAELMVKNLKAEQTFHFTALHSYNYFRGPALLLIGVSSHEPVKSPEPVKSREPTKSPEPIKSNEPNKDPSKS